MNKKELIESLEGYPDNTEIVLWAWTGRTSVLEYLNQTCSNHPERGYFSLANSFISFRTDPTHERRITEKLSKEIEDNMKKH